jgi:hypothetical protein
MNIPVQVFRAQTITIGKLLERIEFTLCTYISVSIATYLVLLLYHYMFRPHTAIIRRTPTLAKLFHRMLKLHVACGNDVNY